MKVIRVDLHKDYADAIREAIHVLQSGGAVVYPTDALYALGANALDERAVEKVYRIKHRSTTRPVQLVVKNILWATELAQVTGHAQAILQAIWPGKITAILPKKDIIPKITTAALNTVALRIPDFVFVDKLLGKFGYPLTATSATLSGEIATRNIDKIVELFTQSNYRPDLVIDVGVLPESGPSTVIDLSTERPKIVRVGAAKPEQLMEILKL